MKVIKTACVALLAGALLLGETACNSMTNTGKGALIGGGGGAGLGAGIGALIGGGKGAGIGAAIGAAVGSGDMVGLQPAYGEVYAPPRTQLRQRSHHRHPL